MDFNPTTFVFEIINFLVLVWLLHRLLYRPLQRAMATRRAELDTERAQAQAARQAAQALEQEWNQRHAELAQTRAQVRSEVLEAAAAERERILKQAKDDAQAERTRAAARIEAERADVERWAGELAAQRCTGLAATLLMRLAPQAIEQAAISGLLQVVASQAEQLRADPELTENGGAATVEIRAARLPDEAQLEALRNALAGALGRRPAFSIIEDESLIGGFRVDLGGHVLDASVSGLMSGLSALAEEGSRSEPQDRGLEPPYAS